MLEQLTRQVFVVRSQTCGLVQSVSALQPFWHIIVAMSQYCPAGQAAAPQEPWLHKPVDVSQV
jgi:hypothetical protein